MLILTRKLYETIKIGDNIKITVVRIERGQIKLGIDAPATVKVMRGEHKQQKRKNNFYLMP